MPRSSLRWTGPHATFASSPGIGRAFCGRCGAPMSFETDIFPGETHLHAAGLDAPCVHTKGLQDAAARGETIVERRRQPDGRA